MEEQVIVEAHRCEGSKKRHKDEHLQLFAVLSGNGIARHGLNLTFFGRVAERVPATPGLTAIPAATPIGYRTKVNRAR